MPKPAKVPPADASPRKPDSADAEDSLRDTVSRFLAAMPARTADLERGLAGDAAINSQSFNPCPPQSP